MGLEMVGIYLVGRELGGLYTLLALLFSLAFGGWLIRHAGTSFLPELAGSLQSGHAPIGILWKTGRKLAAGLLLIFPGFFSDAVALILLLWPGAAAPAPTRSEARDGVIEGEWRREEEDGGRLPPSA
ncbi:MAG: FxsA family protein [Betaproteobacteria bacterium]|nr:FxsA family protein [Betaproteobacteria bacterium]